MTTTRPLGFWSATALVVGSIIGSGAFLLPAALAPFGAASLLGWGAVSTVTARALTDLARQYDSLAPRASLLGPASGLLLFAVGSSAVLRYATGSPWPLFG